MISKARERELTQSSTTSLVVNQGETCCFCGAEGLKEAYRFKARNKKTYLLAACECGTKTLLTKPNMQELAEAYDESYYGEGETKFPNWIEKSIEYFRRTRARKVARLCKQPGKVLDVGCGNGKFLTHLAELGFDCSGLELPGKSAERAKLLPGLKIDTEPLYPGKFPANYFDVITLWHVFEHLAEPKETLEMLHACLRSGGWLILSLPNIDSWQSRLFRGHWFHLDPPRHLFFMGPRKLERYLEKLGFEHLHTQFHSLEQNPFGFQQSLLNALGYQRDELYEQLKGNQTANGSFWSKGVRLLYFFLSFPAACLCAGIEALCGAGGTMELVFKKC